MRELTRREVGAEAHRDYMRARRDLFTRYVDITVGRGLEIGPLDSAISDPATDDVRYVDVFETEGVRAHYATDENVIVELVPHIDFPIIQDGVTRSLAEAATPGAPYDWIVASHVIEHVPDVIGWLQDVAALAADGASLLLAVPDRRYCFDRLRPPTTAGQAILAHELGDTRPNTRAIYDYFSSAVQVDTSALWLGEPPPGRNKVYADAAEVAKQVARGREGEYVDCHVWTFTPWAFLEQLQEWRELGLSEWYVEVLEPHEWTVEFFAVLRRANRDGAPLPVTEPVPPSDAVGWLYDETAQLRHQVGQLQELVDVQALKIGEISGQLDLREARLDLLRERNAVLRTRIKRLRHRNERLKARLVELDVPLAQRLRRAVARRVGGRSS